MKGIDEFYLKQEEPIKGMLLVLREIILNQDKDVAHGLKYGMPFFCYKGKMFCYLWVDKKNAQPYIGIVEGKYFDEPFLIKGDRSRMKIMMLNADEDLPLKTIEHLIQKVINLYKRGIVKV